ncbi:hypothetical protein [Mesoflavibacter sp. CH_XMU1422-2]|uniref:hypothetical protein n=1 Tax=Mesoflavibacter sp. CH_XMU1422-2 TaxID=3107770 RepID=UPI00300AA72C
MDDFLLFWGIILLIGVILFFGIPYLVFYTLKKLGKPKVGKIIGSGILLVFIFFTTYVLFEDYFFFKSSATNELKQMNLVLNDDFEIIKNESGGFTDYYQVFELKISEQDAIRLTKNKNAKSELITVSQKVIENNIWKQVKIDTENKVLIYEYFVN